MEKFCISCISNQWMQKILTWAAACGEQKEQECEIFSHLWAALCRQRSRVCSNWSVTYSQRNAELLCEAQMWNTKCFSEQWQRINTMWSWNTMNEFKSLNASVVDFKLWRKVQHNAVKSPWCSVDTTTALYTGEQHQTTPTHFCYDEITCCVSCIVCVTSK